MVFVVANAKVLKARCNLTPPSANRERKVVNTSVALQDGVQGAVGGLGAATGGLGAAVGGAPPPLLPLHNSGMNNVGAGAGSSALQSQAVAQLSSQLAAQTLNTVQVTSLGDVSVLSDKSVCEH